jgi:hypothetical protein
MSRSEVAEAPLLQEREEPLPILRDRRPWASWDTASRVGALGVVVGLPLVVESYRYAAVHATSEVPFVLFWLGFLLVALPIGWHALSATAGRRQRYTVVALLGAWGFVPKLLRNPGGPLYSDEIAHWRQTLDVVSSGHLYPPNSLIPLIPEFPGEQALLAALHQISGLSVWTSGELVVGLLHLSSVVAMFLIGERLLGSARAGAVVAVLYSLNPGYLFFDAQVSYESFGLPLLIWTLAAAVHVTDPRLGQRTRNAWSFAGILTGAACVVTHHLSSYVLAVVLLAIALAASWARSRATTGSATTPPSSATTPPSSATAPRSSATAPTSAPSSALGAWLLALSVAAFAVAWGLLVGRRLTAYYSPFVSGGLTQLWHIVSQGASRRKLFGGTSDPRWEVVCAFASPVLAGLCVVAAFVTMRRRLASFGPTFLALALLTVGYFLSLPFTLTTLGSEGAHRSWSYSYIGLALVAGAYLAERLIRRDAPALVREPDSEHGASEGRFSRLRHAARAANGRLFPGLVAVALTIVLVGNTAASIDVEYRFPGPYVYGSDTRSLTAELRFVSGWFESHLGAHAGVITDHFTGEGIGGLGDADLAQASPGFPVWGLYFDKGKLPVGLLAAVGAARYPYLVVDRQMASHVPAIGVYFNDAEPGAFDHRSPVPAAALNRYRHVWWATEVFDSTDYAVYRLDLPALASGAAR